MTCVTGPKLQGISRGVSLKEKQIVAETYRDFKTNQVLAENDATIQIDERGNYRGLS